MTRRITGPALSEVDNQLDLKGSRPSQDVTFHDDDLAQVFDTTLAVRRGRTGPNAGWFFASIQHVHPSSGTLTTSQDPFSPGAFAAGSLYPRIIPRGFDLWIESVAVQSTAGLGDSINHWLVMLSDSNFGWGITTPAATIFVGINRVPLAMGNGTRAGGTLAFFQDFEGKVRIPVGMRVPRRPGGFSLLVFESTAGSAATIVFHVQLGLFPAGMGSDAAHGVG